MLLRTVVDDIAADEQLVSELTHIALKKKVCVVSILRRISFEEAFDALIKYPLKIFKQKTCLFFTNAI